MMTDIGTMVCIGAAVIQQQLGSDYHTVKVTDMKLFVFPFHTPLFSCKTWDEFWIKPDNQRNLLDFETAARRKWPDLYKLYDADPAAIIEYCKRAGKATSSVFEWMQHYETAMREAIAEFALWYDELCNRSRPKTISDNPAYDGGMINYLLDRYAKHPPLGYILDARLSYAYDHAVLCSRSLCISHLAHIDGRRAAQLLSKDRRSVFDEFIQRRPDLSPSEIPYCHRPEYDSAHRAVITCSLLGDSIGRVLGEEIGTKLIITTPL